MLNTLKHRNGEKEMERKMKDYRLVVNGWFAYKNDLPQYPAKVYEVREKAINALFFKKAEKEGEKDKPVYKWVPVSQLVVRGEYTTLEGLAHDLFNHYKKCEIKNDFANDNKIDISINDFAIEKVSEKALYLVKGDVKKWVPKNSIIVEIPLSIVIDKLDLINKLGFINDIN